MIVKSSNGYTFGIALKINFPHIKRIYCSFLLLVAGSANAQISVADSLATLLAKARPDTHRVSLLTDYAWEINETKSQESAQKLQEAIHLAQKLHFVSGEASAWNGLGVVEEIRGNISQAIIHYKKALTLRKAINDRAAIASQYNNLGTAYEQAGDFDSSLVALKEGLRLAEELKDTNRIARLHLNMGGVFEEMGSYPEAYEQVNIARMIFEARRDTIAIAKTYPLLGHIRFELEMKPEAYAWYTEALQLRERIGEPQGIADALSDLGNVMDEMEVKDSSRQSIKLYLRALEIYKKMDDQPGIANVYNNLGVAYKHLDQFEQAMSYLRRCLDIRLKLEDQPGLMEVYNSIGDVSFGRGNFQEALEYTTRYQNIALAINDQKFEQKAYKDFSKIYAALGDFVQAYDYRVKYDELRYRRLDEARSKDFERKEARFIDDRRKKENEKQRHELELRDAQIARNNITKNALIGGGVLLAILAAMLYNRGRLRERINKQLAAKNRAIERERERADVLLRNILPEKAAQELMLHKTVQPVRHESVTVMFTDFQGFTKIAELVPPEDLIGELDECFRIFDAIVEDFKLEKIKTIGDSYMCAGGLPVSTETHPEDMVAAAIEMQRQLTVLMQQKAAENKPVFEMRIGIHTGPVVAGVVGSHKFAYDIWGDTVNTAARLEQGGEAGKINISETTYQRVKHRYQCEFRGKLAAKNKGEIAMYFVSDQV
jgi:adenylate cyclase